MTVIDLMRHGEPVGGRYYRGQIDDPLSEKGWQQMWAAAEDHVWDCIVSSTLQRCSGFARALAEKRRLPVSVDERLKEIGFGAWEGHTPDQLRQNDPEGFRAFFNDPVIHRPPGAEALAAFYERVTAAWQTLVTEYADRHVLVVAHAGVIRVIFCHILDIALANMYRIQVRNAGLTRIKVEANAAPQLVFHGL